MALNKYQLKNLLGELKALRSRHTELVSVYVPADFNINIVKNQLSQEASTASNIKSKTTRKNVLAALDKAISELKYYNATPDNGLVVLAGNVANNPGDMDLRAWSFEPPEKVAVRLYKCEQEFILEPLTDMLEPKYVYGLIVIDEKDLVIGLLKGKKIQLLREKSSVVPGKTRAGGQSAPRFQRVRQEIIKDWYRISGTLARELFSVYNNMKGLLIGGGGPSKESFVDSGHLGELGKKVITVQDTGHSGVVALEELVVKSQSALEQEEVMAEKKVVNNFLEHLGKDDGIAVYGIAEVKKFLEQGIVNVLLLSESLDSPVVDELTKIAESFGTEPVLVSVDTKEGEQLSHLGGAGAILRYKVSRS
ncbi:MAG: peptide chain release factor aRF-1 [Candidatus Nanoarchaeia archaeon]|jgi:peptide chain release factor subunit 1